jgi:hypothetical protein
MMAKMSDFEVTKYKLSPPEPRGAFNKREEGCFVVHVADKAVVVSLGEVKKTSGISFSSLQSCAIRWVGGITEAACCSDKCQ